MTLLEDQSVQIAFTVNLKKPLFNVKNLNKTKETERNIGINRFSEMSLSAFSLYLFFYNLDGTPDHRIRLNGIQNVYFNGTTEFYITPYIHHMYQMIFKKSPAFLSEPYHVQFTVLPHTLKRLSAGIAIGAMLEDAEKRKWHLIDQQGISFGTSGQSCETFYPKYPKAPEPLKIDPQFKLSSTLWKLKKVDLDTLKEKTQAGTGLKAELMSPAQNRFCLNYISLGTIGRKYRISARNENGLDTTGRFFQLKEGKKNQSIHYKIDFYNTEMTKNDFSLPENHKEIRLKRDENHLVTQMCWSPGITLFSTENTRKGHYSDVLHFIITPLS